MNAILSTIFIAMLPVSELRGAIPVALGIHKMTIVGAYFWAVIGNIIPVFFLLWLLPAVSKILMVKWVWTDKLFSWVFARTRKRTEERMKKYGPVALILFVAIPLPFTGAWTGAIAAFLFGVPAKKALPLIFTGILIAGVVVTLMTTGVIAIGW